MAHLRTMKLGLVDYRTMLIQPLFHQMACIPHFYLAAHYPEFSGAGRDLLHLSIDFRTGTFIGCAAISPQTAHPPAQTRITIGQPIGAKITAVVTVAVFHMRDL